MYADDGIAQQSSPPVDVNPGSSPPVELNAAPVNATVSAPASESTPAVPVTTPVAPVVDAWKGELTTQFGIDVAGFTNRADALTYIRLKAESEASKGWDAPLPFQPNTLLAPSNTAPSLAAPSNTTPTLAPLEGLDLSGLDPKVEAAVKAVLAKAEASDQRVVALEKIYQDQQQRESVALQTSIYTKANAVIDGLASEKYGVGANRTFQQRTSVENLGRIVQGIIAGYANNPNPNVQVPGVEQVIHLALIADQYEFKSVAPAAATPATSNTAALVQKALNSSSPAPPSGNNPSYDKLGLMQDPTFKAGIASIFAGNR